jgi:MFS family permease
MLDVLERQQKLTKNQWKIISAAVLGDMLDFFDYGLIAFALAFIVGHWKLTYGQSAIILLAAGIGAVPGALVWGWLADRIGRRTVFHRHGAQFLDLHGDHGLHRTRGDGSFWRYAASLLVPVCRACSPSTCRWCRNSYRRASAAGSAES